MVTGMLNMMIGPVPPFVDFTVKINVNRRLRTLLEPYPAARKPEVGHFGLPAVYQLLTEYSQLIAYAVAHSRVTAG